MRFFKNIRLLASFVHLLPANKVKQQYRKLTNIRNEALQERLLWKFNFLTPEKRTYAGIRLSETITNPDLQASLLEKFKGRNDKDMYEEILQNIEKNKQA